MAVAVVWALHPGQTNVVNYASQRVEALMALCYLATITCFLRYCETPIDAGRCSPSPPAPWEWRARRSW